MSTQAAGTTQYAVNKTGKLAYKKVGDGEWQAIDFKDVPADAVRVGHERIGDKWFHVLTAN